MTGGPDQQEVGAAEDDSRVVAPPAEKYELAAVPSGEASASQEAEIAELRRGHADFQQKLEGSEARLEAAQLSVSEMQKEKAELERLLGEARSAAASRNDDDQVSEKRDEVHAAQRAADAEERQRLEAERDEARRHAQETRDSAAEMTKQIEAQLDEARRNLQSEREQAVAAEQKFEAELTEAKRHVEDEREKVATSEERFNAVGSNESDEFNLPDFVWNCGNAEVMVFVKKLVAENAQLQKHQREASEQLGGQAVSRSLGQEGNSSMTFSMSPEKGSAPFGSELLDSKTVTPDGAIAFASAITENDGHQVLPLLALLREHAGDAKVCFQACAAFESLTFTDNECRRKIVQNGGVDMILAALERHQDEAADLLRSAMDALWNLTFDDEAVDRASDAGAIQRVTSVMRKHQDSADLQSGACAVLLNLAVKEANRWKIVECGAVALVASAMQHHSESEEVLEQGCQALYMLAYHQDLRPLVLAAKADDAASLAASYSHGAGRAQKWGRWLQEVLAC